MLSQSQKNIFIQIGFFALFFCFISAAAKAQLPSGNNPANAALDTTTSGVPQRIELIRAGVLEGDVVDNEPVRIVKKDGRGQVIFKQKNTYMYCDSAFQYIDQNLIHAYGRVKFVENDSMSVVGDTLFYNGNSKVAKMRGNVLMIDEERTVRTQKLNYDMKTKVAYYFDGGTVQDDNSKLTSDKGYYNTYTKESAFKDNIRVIGTDLDVTSDTLTYSAVTKIVHFNSPSYIKTRDGTIRADEGTEYDTVLGKMKTKKGSGTRPRVDNVDYIIEADFLDYDQATEKGEAEGDVYFYHKTQDLYIYCDHGFYDEIDKKVDAYGNALLVKPDGTDTLFIAADTLVALNDTVPSRRKLMAYPNVKIFRSTMQGRCDSLTYDLNDSLIYFHRDPVLWTDENQISGKEIEIQMANNMPQEMRVTDRSFVISESLFRQYNQIKGKNVRAVFDSLGQVDSIFVDGNGESIYFLLEDENTPRPKLKGMNYVKCSNMLIHFADSNQLESILFIQKPEGKVYPPSFINKENSRLANFAWRNAERPTREVMLSLRKATDTDLRPQGRQIVKNKFEVYKEFETLTVFKENCKVSDLEGVFFIWIYPEDIDDLEGDEKAQGFVNLSFEPSQDDLKGGIYRHKVALPALRIRKMVMGQRLRGRGDIWRETLENLQ
ncbi:MAG: hypothetical protein JJT94_02760 [Bernardetiaceae bacterium]|nr:hypothetical protein [Bernardetiaceae bacterium]